MENTTNSGGVMKDFYKQLETPLDRAIDNAIERENQRFLESDRGKQMVASSNKQGARYSKAQALVDSGLADDLRDARAQLADMS
jgi:hypothetical protein